MKSSHGNRQRPAFWRFVLLNCLPLSLISQDARLYGQENEGADVIVKEASSHGTVPQDDVDPVRTEVLGLLQKQADAWNRGDIDGYMETYWKSSELTFSSGGSTTRGWQATMDRYKKRYSTTALMGQLTFDDIEFQLLSGDVALVLGKWHLKREADEPEGNFSLVLRTIDGNWRIIHDHSSTLEE